MAHANVHGDMLLPQHSNRADHEEQRPAPASRKYQTIVKAIKKQYDFVKSAEIDNLDFTRGNVRHDRLMTQWEELDKLHMEIIDGVGDAEAAVYATTYSETEDLYVEALSLLRLHIDEIRPIDNPGQNEHGSEAAGGQKKNRVEVVLPQQDIKNTWGKFGGDLTQWTGFRDRFIAAIHSNEDVEPAFKYQHLQKSLFGQAAGVLGQGAAKDGKSYEEAWTRLNNVYEDRYAICRAHIHALFNMPVLTEPITADQLRLMSNTTHEQIRQLNAHGIPVDSWDLILCTLLHDRLPSDIVRQWQLGLSADMPTAAGMLEFLDRQAKALGNSSTPSSSTDNIKITINNERVNQNRNMESGQTNQPSTSGRGNKDGRRFPCEACTTLEHQVYKCPDFLGLNYSGRWDFVRRRSLCPNCLKRGHKKEVCYSVKCSDDRCIRKDPAHNSLLCPYKQTQSTGQTMTATKRPA